MLLRAENNLSYSSKYQHFVSFFSVCIFSFMCCSLSVSDAGFLHITPTRLQFFEYESISFTCKGFSGSTQWIGVRNIEEFIPTCSNSTSTSIMTCIVYNAFETDSGKYWCEAGGGVRSNTVNITVTGTFSVSEEFYSKKQNIYNIYIYIYLHKPEKLHYSFDNNYNYVHIWSLTNFRAEPNSTATNFS